jgi:protein-tyrosine phosphatase
MAEGVFQHLVGEAGLSEEILVDSAGTGHWHVGEPAHSGTRAVLQRHGIELNRRARQIEPPEVAEVDYLVAMDSSNYADLRRLDGSAYQEGRLHLLLDFAPSDSPTDVPDPYYENNFERVYELVEAGCQGLLEHIRSEQGL